MGARSAAIQIRAPTNSPSINPEPRQVLGSPSTPVAPTHSSDPRFSIDNYLPDPGRLSPRLPICRTLLLNGVCKSEQDGSCPSSHQTSPVQPTGRKSSPSSPRKFSLPHPTRPATATPMGLGGATLTTDAPVFIPGGTVGQASLAAKAGQQVKLNKAAAEFAPSGVSLGDSNQYRGRTKDEASDTSLDASAEEWYTPNEMNMQNTLYNPSNTSDPTSSYPSSSSTPFRSEPQFHAHNPYAYDSDLLHSHPTSHPLTENYIPHDSYIPHAHHPAPSLSNFQRPLNYHLYAPPLPHSSNQHPHQLALNSFFMPASIRETLQRKSAAVLQGPTHEVARTPEELGVYHSLVVIDSPHAHAGAGGAASTGALSHRSALVSRVFGSPSWIYKAFCALDGKAYCLYRIEGVQLKPGQGEAAIGQVERWRKIRHPGIVNVREAFTTRAFGDHSILFAYDYHPLSQTLFDEHVSGKKKSTFGTVETEQLSRLHSSATVRYNHRQRHAVGNGHTARPGLVEERVVWSYLVQIASAVRAVHQANLAVRTIDPTKVLLTGANRVRINGCGIMDVTEYSPNQSLEELQREDLRDLGILVCTITSGSDCPKADPSALSKGLEYVKQFYSRELNEAITYLLRPHSDEGGPVSIDGLLGMIWSRSLEEVTKVFNHNDLLEECLGRELENGRLVRLMTKLGFINERPEFDHDPNWSETSERYLLKLFRDYVFHQVDGHGKPVTDLSHVLVCLNKLDAGLDEKIMLVSRDEQTCAVVSYAEIRRIMDLAFRDLSR